MCLRISFLSDQPKLSKTIYLFLLTLLIILPAFQVFTQSVTINWSQTRQEIDGFGASAAFRQADDLKAFPVAEKTRILDLLFSQTDGIGLSIVRNMVGDGSMSEWGNSIDGPVETIEPQNGVWNYSAVDEQIWFMQEAKTRGCTRFMSTVWSPPRWMKTNNSCINGGSVSTNMYPNFADYLVNYAKEYLKNRNGLDLYAVSVANEPDLSTGYSSCLWSADQFRVFVRDHLGPKFRTAGLSTKIMVGEHSNWTEAPAQTLLNDSQGVGYLDIVASHNYNGSTYNAFTTTKSKNKKVWETEVSNLGDNDSSMNDGLKWAKQIHDFLINAEGNAWLYWWAICYKVNPAKGEGLININTSNKTWYTNKRLYTMGNYSRFIRPGWYRLSTSATTVNGVRISAFKNSTSGECAVVAINESGSSQTIEFSFSGTTISKLTPYVTSTSSDLAKQTDVSAANGVFRVTLTGTSVTTFSSGQGTNPGMRGDVNGDGIVNIIDALMIAQYSVGLNPTGFIAANADVTNDGQITIVDALKVAQYYVGIITSL